MREPWKMSYFTAESGYSSARRLQRLVAQGAMIAANQASAAAKAQAESRPALALPPIGTPAIG